MLTDGNVCSADEKRARKEREEVALNVNGYADYSKLNSIRALHARGTFMIPDSSY